MSFIIVGLVIWKCYARIKLNIFLKCGVRLPDCKRKRRKFIAKGIIEYDAFLCSTRIDDDIDEFVETWNERLEPGEELKLCLHYVDFMPGDTISDSIDNAISSSRNVIVFLSQRYCQSDWCKYEFEQAHHRAVKDKTFKLIVILIEPKSEMKKAQHRLIRKYLDSGAYLKLGDPRFWEKFQVLIGK